MFQDNLEEFQCAQCYDVEINLEAKGYNIPEQYLGSICTAFCFLHFLEDAGSTNSKLTVKGTSIANLDSVHKNKHKVKKYAVHTALLSFPARNFHAYTFSITMRRNKSDTTTPLQPNHHLKTYMY